MIRAFFRLLAMISLAVAVIMAVLDATRTVAAKTLVMTPLLTSWQAGWPDGLAAFQAFVEQKLAGFLWDPVATALLGLPGFLIFLVIAFLLYALGRKPERRIGRFVVDE
jgi:hypothetical protein